MTVFGHNFVVLSDVQQIINPSLFGGGPWLHLATVTRGFREYVALRHQYTNDVYLQIVDLSDPTWFRTIEDENEFNDLAAFLIDAKLLEVGTRREISLGIDALRETILKGRNG